MYQVGEGEGGMKPGHLQEAACWTRMIRQASKDNVNTAENLTSLANGSDRQQQCDNRIAIKNQGLIWGGGG